MAAVLAVAAPAAAGGSTEAVRPRSPYAAGGDGRAAEVRGGGGGGTILAASLRGRNEVAQPGGPAADDPDGTALQFVEVEGDEVSVAVEWRGTGRPVGLRLHEGGDGADGSVRVDFTGQLDRARQRTFTGRVEVRDAALLERLRTEPEDFYANLYTSEFPGGAVRGRLHHVTTPFDFRYALRSFQAAVVEGEQVYVCKEAADGTTAFAQRDVRARLDRGVRHSFVAPDSGTPQWVAPDRSAVTGTVLTRTPNGDGNIPELDLGATPSGARHGLFAGVAEVLRLNTVGGAAPAGSCRTGTVVGVPYRADYVFVRS
ncbi:hypothetical protein GCM10010358_16010 [Streptomyces minutiscleroticus]|uniref:CHRD domain-containing protein n=1 Tax=Streptomyces minutiscleroticus TaxID=68238 RepID=A0A918KG46_9ACTN|nr:hypothetical protein GCM10010358_16010 [Streptomyces minutiscleroticus]